MDPSAVFPGIFPIGDNALTLQAGPGIDSGLNQQLLVLQQQVSQSGFPGLQDSILSYNSLSIYYDPFVLMEKVNLPGTAFEWVKEWIQKAWDNVRLHHNNNAALGQVRQVEIPVCYHESLAIDRQRWDHLSHHQLVELHQQRSYRVYMLGFLPGFPYMGEVDELLFMPRKEKPETVEAGSVGIAGLQTGIYPFSCPGGWNIIGRTPVKLFDASAEWPTLLRPGDEVRFVAIGLEEYQALRDAEK